MPNRAAVNSRQDQVAVVTGAGRGMGRQIAWSLASAGTHVVAAARTASDLSATVAGAPSGCTIIPRPCDVSDPDEVDALFDEILAEHGRLDVLVCSHGLYRAGGSALELPLAQFDRTMAVNLRGTLHCAQRAGLAMRAGCRGGRIVLISSINGEASQTGAADYDISKAAVNGLCRAFAVELARDTITVNAIAPGWIRTPMSAEELDHLEPTGIALNPSHRVGLPEDIALAVMWLTDPKNSYVTGTVIRIDGGQGAALLDPAGVVPTADRRPL
jgi:NAD(P)-dependent dehydrogenase (short-subunit alcohol dehydrogenase family)